jgi:histidinol dehydrogenase
MADLTLDADMLKTAFDNLGDKEKTALQVAANRVRTYHEKQKQTTWTYREDNGTMLGQKITPIERVGLYVPGGKAAYPSSVLMNAIPAKVAGVEELIMVVPTPNGVIVPIKWIVRLRRVQLVRINPWQSNQGRFCHHK